jgi:hypothetical protein
MEHVLAFGHPPHQSLGWNLITAYRAHVRFARGLSRGLFKFYLPQLRFGERSHHGVAFRDTCGDEIFMQEVGEDVRIHLQLFIAASLLVQGLEDYTES